MTRGMAPPTVQLGSPAARFQTFRTAHEAPLPKSKGHGCIVSGGGPASPAACRMTAECACGPAGWAGLSRGMHYATMQAGLQAIAALAGLNKATFLVVLQLPAQAA